MNRLFTLILIGLAGLLASCGSSVSSSTQPGSDDVYSVVVSPYQFTLNSGDWATVGAVVVMSHKNATPQPVSPQPTIRFSSSDTRVSVSPAGEVCAGQWDSRYLVCKPTSTLPVGRVTITAYDASHNVSETSLVSVHQRAARITLSAPLYGGAVTVSTLNGQPVSNIPLGQYPSTTNCVSQNNYLAVAQTDGTLFPVNNTQVRYVASAVDESGNPVANVFSDDYAWSTDSANVATVSSFGDVAARNPGVTNVYATLNGTKSVPLAFVTCPPSSIVIASSADTNVGLPPVSNSYTYTTGDLTLKNGDQKYLTATMLDTNKLPLFTMPLTYITSDTLTGSFASILPLTSTLTASTAGRFTAMASCEPSTCNNSVADFISPTGASTGKAAGFGYPIYSNVIGVTVQGIVGSTVLVTGKTLAKDGVTPAFLLQTYDSESLLVTHSIGLANTPNSMVVAPSGTKAYVGSSAGLMVVDLSSYQSTILNFPVVGGNTNPPELVTGAVLGVSPDNRYVLVSDVPNGLVFLIDTTGTKTATRYSIPGINAVTFAADGSNFWIGGTGGVYIYQSDTFIKTPANASSNVRALAWMPDGQSYFASGDQLFNYSTCDDQFQVPPNASATNQLTGGSPINLNATALNGVPHAVGLSVSDNLWYDYPVTTTAQVGNQTVTQLSSLVPGGAGDVCLSKVTVSPKVTTASSLSCTARQVTFSPTLEEEFVTGVDPACSGGDTGIHGYALNSPGEFILPTTSTVVPLSGGVLNDGRKLYFGTYDAANGALLHRINLDPTAGPIGEEIVTATTGTAPNTVTSVTIPAAVAIVPDFVAVVPK